jgi:hypothetical protein
MTINKSQGQSLKYVGVYLPICWMIDFGISIAENSQVFCSETNRLSFNFNGFHWLVLIYKFGSSCSLSITSITTFKYSLRKIHVVWQGKTAPTDLKDDPSSNRRTSRKNRTNQRRVWQGNLYSPPLSNPTHGGFYPHPYKENGWLRVLPENIIQDECLALSTRSSTEKGLPKKITSLPDFQMYYTTACQTKDKILLALLSVPNPAKASKWTKRSLGDTNSQPNLHDTLYQTDDTIRQEIKRWTDKSPYKPQSSHIAH